MAGFIINLDSKKSLKDCIESGIYGTRFKKIPLNELWMAPHEGTFADFIGMKAGDNIYFFIDRRIYGIGILINKGFDCKYLNFPGADRPIPVKRTGVKSQLLYDNKEKEVNIRSICLFQPSPFFFEKGVDMDDVLSSKPDSFKMLRAFWKLSFIKVDDEENRALRDILLKRNEEYVAGGEGTYGFNIERHNHIEEVVTEAYRISAQNILESCSDGSLIRHEMAIEAGIIDAIRKGNSIFGHWDYLTHQVIASPFKPIDYMDKMDVFGYRYIPGFDTISRYLVIEIKKDNATKEAVDQVMKYVDWINQEYAYGDYSMIQAFLVASGFPEEVVVYRDKVCKRNYLKGRRPAVSEEWTYVKLISYEYRNGELHFIEV